MPVYRDDIRPMLTLKRVDAGAKVIPEGYDAVAVLGSTSVMDDKPFSVVCNKANDVWDFDILENTHTLVEALAIASEYGFLPSFDDVMKYKKLKLVEAHFIYAEVNTEFYDFPEKPMLILGRCDDLNTRLAITGSSIGIEEFHSVTMTEFVRESSSAHTLEEILARAQEEGFTGNKETVEKFKAATRHRGIKMFF